MNYKDYNSPGRTRTDEGLDVPRMTARELWKLGMGAGSVLTVRGCGQPLCNTSPAGSELAHCGLGGPLDNCRPHYKGTNALTQEL